MSSTIAPYGSWKSEITADLITSEAIGFAGTLLDGDDLYWIEMRPAEGGRYVLMALEPDGSHREVTPKGWNVRTRVHEYGGASALVSDGVVWFSNFADQRLYRQPLRLERGDEPVPITPDKPLRFSDAVHDRGRDRLIAVCEDHSGEGEAENYLVAIQAHGRSAPVVLARGRDFYAAPRLSVEGSRLAWIEWDHPNMPWDGTELRVAEISSRGLDESRLVAGARDESVVQPVWSPDGSLYFVSDRSGWWNLYRERAGEVTQVVRVDAEMGRPHWGFGTSTYGLLSANEAICCIGRQGKWSLERVDLESGECSEITTPYSFIDDIRVGPGVVSFEGGASDRPIAVCRMTMDGGTTTVEEIRKSSDVDIDAGLLAVPEAIEFPTSGGGTAESGRTAHGFYYPPTNAAYRGPDGERPPLLVMSHGGPTGATSDTFNLRKLFWTSRGIAVLDVNYGGSTGYGRDYRRRLNGRWGIVDVDDCAHGASYLAGRGDVDGARLAITGGSAGGWTTLCALTFGDTFAAGASHFGVSDAEALAKDTHKFESRYLDSLIGPYPERQDLYTERSPIHHTDRLSCPVAFFQGLEDKIVPPDQSERMADALRKKGLPVAYLAFPGEQHGFRRAENIKRALEAELYFYSRILGFDLADPVEPLEIENL